MLARIIAFEPPGLALRRLRRDRFTLPYGEILTAERLASAGLRLHTRTNKPIRVVCRGKARGSTGCGLLMSGAQSSRRPSKISKPSSDAVPKACDNRLTVAEPNRTGGDPKLVRLFDE